MSSDPTQPVPEWWKQPQDPQGTLPLNQGYPQDQGYPAGQGYRGTQALPSQEYPVSRNYQGAPPRARRRRRKWPIIALIVIIVLLVVADRGAKAYAENRMASQLQSSMDLSGKPDVSIQGFPFLTQLASRDFRTVNISASNETAGPGGQFEIASLTGTLHGCTSTGRTAQRSISSTHRR